MKKFLAVAFLSVLLFAGISTLATENVNAQSIKRFRFHFRCAHGRRVVITVRTRRYRRHAESYAYSRARERGCVRPNLVRAVRL